MTTDLREVNRKLRILNHANQSDNIAKTCRYFGIPRSLFYVWHNTYCEFGDDGQQTYYQCVLNARESLIAEHSEINHSNMAAMHADWE